MNLLTVLANTEISTLLISLGLSLLIGAAFAVTYLITNKKAGYDRSMLLALILLPLIVSVLILLVKNDIAKVFSLGGIFVLIRFRVRVKDMRDAAYLFSVIAVGFACGLEDFIIAAIIAVVVLIVLLVLHALKLDAPQPATYRLKVLIPENLDYVNVFDSVFEKYLKSSTLKKVKLTDFGSLVELTYIITMIDPKKQKAFLDELRQKNGNLTIIIADDYDKLVETAN